LISNSTDLSGGQPILVDFGQVVKLQHARIADKHTIFVVELAGDRLTVETGDLENLHEGFGIVSEKGAKNLVVAIYTRDLGGENLNPAKVKILTFAVELVHCFLSLVTLYRNNEKIQLIVGAKPQNRRNKKNNKETHKNE
jgi:hypothetical protein